MSEQITGLRRSHIHKNPKHELDIQALVDAHKEHEIHNVVPGRKIHKDNKAKDVIEAGIQSVCEGNILKDFHTNREVYFNRISTEQVFDDVDTPIPSPSATSPAALNQSLPAHPAVTHPSQLVDPGMATQI